MSLERDIYVQIAENDRYPIPNRLRRAYLYIIQNEDFKVPTLCECYMVLNKPAQIFSWVDSAFGRRYKFMEAENTSLLPTLDIEGFKAILTLVGRKFEPWED